jgi:phage replication-related protein YjqB (UPF0714/DUF867 family)
MKYMEYANFDNLRRHEEGCYSIERIDRRSSIVIIAPHAGQIEPSTGKIARKIARDIYSIYLFIGHRRKFKKEPGGGRMRSLHITSANFDEPKAMEFVKSRKVALAVHGLDNDVANRFHRLDIYVGGRNRDLREKVVANLKREEFKVADCMQAGFETFPHKGQEPKNIVNMCGGGTGGVQLEITKRERNALVGSRKRMNRFCDAIREALDSFV